MEKAYVEYSLPYLERALGIPYDVVGGKVEDGKLLLEVEGSAIVERAERVIAHDNVYDRDYLLAKIETQIKDKQSG